MTDAQLRTIRTAATDVFADTPVFLAYAYGSRVSGTPRPGSDLDVGYYLNENTVTGQLPIREEMILADRLSRAVGLEVDLRYLGPAPLEARGRILEAGVRIYCSDECARVANESRLLSVYHDCKAKLTTFHEERLAAFAQGA